MCLKNTAEHWGSVSKILHWLIALLILALGVVGLMMGELPKTPKYFWVYTAHKSMGVLVLLLVMLRLAWRVYAGAPHAVPGTPTWQERVASLTHWLLYGLMVAVPLAGWIFDSASGLRPFRLFGWLNMPRLVEQSEQTSQISHAIHVWGFWLLVLVVLGHAGAALYHHIVQRDATLARMLPRGWLKLS